MTRVARAGIAALGALIALAVQGPVDAAPNRQHSIEVTGPVLNGGGGPPATFDFAATRHPDGSAEVHLTSTAPLGGCFSETAVLEPASRSDFRIEAAGECVIISGAGVLRFPFELEMTLELTKLVDVSHERNDLDGDAAWDERVTERVSRAGGAGTLNAFVPILTEHDGDLKVEQREVRGR